MSDAPSTTGKNKAILTDVTKCIGCERCVEGCVQVNKLPRDFPAHFKAEDGLSARRFTSIVTIDGREKGTWRMVRRQCMHCLEPSCAAACLVGAFTKRPDGAVEYDPDKCIGCRYCMLACPFMIPRYEYDSLLPLVRKCRMNEDCRVAGGRPACVSSCPTGATVFGPRDRLIDEANRRIAAQPGLYVNHIYGEQEMGGTSVIYISDVPLHETLRIPTTEDFEKLAVPNLAKDSIPDMIHNWVLVTPFQFFTVATALTGIHFLKRRTRIMEEKRREEAKAALDDSPTSDDSTTPDDNGEVRK
jgi:formate dehydrogenase iron-sulfur subunit